MLCVVCVVGFERSGVGEEGENGAGIGDRRHPFFCACHITGSPSIQGIQYYKGKHGYTGYIGVYNIALIY